MRFPSGSHRVVALNRYYAPVQLYGSTYSTDVCILVQQNILRILTAEIANL
eukprot:COSAG01_NODE_67901_length_265_cov_1.572289_1_plen_50_part_01